MEWTCVACGETSVACLCNEDATEEDFEFDELDEFIDAGDPYDIEYDC